MVDQNQRYSHIIINEKIYIQEFVVQVVITEYENNVVDKYNDMHFLNQN